MTTAQPNSGTEQVETPAPYRVIAASDFSPLGDRAVLEALHQCAAHENAALHVITVGAESPTGVILPGDEVRTVSKEDAHERARRHLAGLIDGYLVTGRPLQLERVAFYVTTGTPSVSILSLAVAVDADLIVLGTHGRHGISRWILGSVAQEVVRRAPCGVLVIRPRDFLEGEKLPDIEPPLRPGEHALLPFRTPPTYHYVSRVGQGSSRLMPAL